ncbi:AEC family transporter [Arvimicrobium flavum]|uniref:AEC family transporter n=1 Tax=Arvimicrobium flavum TaxID=3393320 RepID=UPI00237BC8E5|nr:AEC family transporter [Mesorhizobium shangrilense]
MSPIVETTLFIFGLIALGYLAGRTGYLKREVGDGLSAFAVRVALPMLLFRTLVEAHLTGLPWGLWAVYFTAVTVAWTTGHLITTRGFGRDSQAGVVGGVSSAFSNLVLLGAPFMLGVFGQPGFELLSLLISIHLPIMLMVSMALFEVFGRPKGASFEILHFIRFFLGQLVRNPLIIGIIAGLLWRTSGIPLPPLADRFVDALANIAAPVALFAMGIGLGKFPVSGNIRPALVLSAVKLFLMPAVALAVAVVAGLPPFTTKVVVIAAALPSGVNSYLIATQFGTGQALASNQMTIATAVAVVTMSIWLGILQFLFG